MRTWSRPDGAKVELSEYSELRGPRILRVYKAGGYQVIHKLFEYWQVREATGAAEDMAELIGAEEVHAEVHTPAA